MTDDELTRFIADLEGLLRRGATLEKFPAAQVVHVSILLKMCHPHSVTLFV